MAVPVAMHMAFVMIVAVAMPMTVMVIIVIPPFVMVGIIAIVAATLAVARHVDVDEPLLLHEVHRA